MWKNVVFYVSREICVKSHKLPQVILLESASFEADDYKFRNLIPKIKNKKKFKKMEEWS